MARHEIEILHIDDDHGPLVEAVAVLATKAEGWMNVEPAVDDEDRVEPPGMFTWFTARGPKVPVGTFVPGSGRDPASVGLSHGAGRDAVEHLVAAGVAPPPTGPPDRIIPSVASCGRSTRTASTPERWCACCSRAPSSQCS